VNNFVSSQRPGWARAVRIRLISYLLRTPKQCAAKAPVDLPVEDVLEQERLEVAHARDLRLGTDPNRAAPLHSSVGLAFSGGGIRSATFNLGVLQALAKKNLLHGFDYISTVSGGGYIGGWLMAWMEHQGIGIKQVAKHLGTPPKAPQQAADRPEIHYLRSYSNYLTPRKGVLGADFWAFAASYLRNTLLNQMILVLALLSLLLAPRVVVYVLHLLEVLEERAHNPWADAPWYFMSQYLSLFVGLAFGAIAVVFIGLNFVTIDPDRQDLDWRFASQGKVHFRVVLPLLLAAGFFTYGFAQFVSDWGVAQHPWLLPPIIGLEVYLSLWVGALIVLRVVKWLMDKERGIVLNNAPNETLVLGTAALTGALIGYLFLVFAAILSPCGPPGVTYTKWHVMTFGVPAEIGIMLLAGVLHIGLMGRYFRDANREWWGRLGGLLILYAVAWLFIFQVAIYFPWGFGQLLQWEAEKHHHAVSAGTTAFWIISTGYGVFFGKSKYTSAILPNDNWKKKLPAYAAKLTPYIFILGLLLGVSLLAAFLAAKVTGNGLTYTDFPSDLSFSVWVPVLFAGSLAAAVALSFCVDINEFSIHYLYRNRLIRCFLGAPVLDRHAQPFTGFTEKDNFALGRLRIPLDSCSDKDARPIPIFNTSLNVVRGKELAVQARKARSFAFTPAYAGFTRALQGSREWQGFYAPTPQAACAMPGFPEGITLGTVVAISGAAASPNMGFYSQPALGFLMTVFDVRLGWWLGNPARDKWTFGSPRVGFYWLLRELLGYTNDDSEFVYVSDGGHFENLGVYELVRRRCKLIVACDASCDSEYKFGDLHNAMERCRADFGVDISFEKLAPLKPQPSLGDPDCRRAQQHYAVGTIDYHSGSPADNGTIIYIKPTLVEGDPRDVLAYAGIDKEFPHDSTVNQWFDEAHFESYRALGEAAASKAAAEIGAQLRPLLHLPAATTFYP
jgi:hypothetical protein